jgi:hypothetical protein
MSTRATSSYQDPRYFQLWLTFDWPKADRSSPGHVRRLRMARTPSPTERGSSALPAVRRPNRPLDRPGPGPVERRQPDRRKPEVGRRVSGRDRPGGRAASRG